MDVNSYLSTGEFADLVGTTKHTLFHYDKLGIFSPVRRGGNGYRHYAVSQVEVFYVIQVLRDLGMSLDDVKSYIDRRSPDMLVSLLKERSLEIDRRITRFSSMKKLIDKKIKSTVYAATANMGTVFLEDRPNEPFVVSDAGSWTDEKTAWEMMSRHIKRCSSIGMAVPCSIGQILDREVIEKEEYDCARYFYSELSEDTGKANHIKKAGLYLTVYHKGYTSIGEGYRRIMDFAEERGLDLGRFFYEDVILDELSVRGYDDFVVKISAEAVERPR